MPQSKYVPKHRNAPKDRALARSVRRSVTYSGIAVAATGVAVSGGVAFTDDAPAESASVQAAVERSGESSPESSSKATVDRNRSAAVSRSDRRPSLKKKQALDQSSGGQVTRTESLADQDPRDVARRLMPDYGLSEAEFGCLDSLWVSESDWDPTADNPISTAYGIPQALTGGTHKNLPADYMTNPVSQIRWGLEYIRDSYGTACSAWEFKQANNWY